MKLSHVSSLLSLISLSIALPAPSPQAPALVKQDTKFGRLIVFGDSFSDNGTGAWEVSKHTWPADPAYYEHSFSNGPVWPITLSQSLNIPLLDFAVGGATADGSLVPGFTGPNSSIPVPSAFNQVQSFLSTDSPKADDLFVHYIGANDPLFNPRIQGSQIISLINRDIDLLYRAGAKNILLANYPPISSFPAAYGVPLYQAIGPAYASALSKGLNEIRAPYSPFINIRVVDVEGLFQKIIARPEEYGIEGRYVDPPIPCLMGTYGTESRKLCEDPERHLFFDVYHPTGKVHGLIAEEFERTSRA